MSERKISDEIRNDFLRNDDVGGVAYRQLLFIADRIDREMVELPKDADGVPIHVGDTVWLNSSQIVHVTSIAFQQDKTTLVCWTGNQYMDRLPGEVTIERHDSLERIADELEAAKGWRDQNGERSRIVSSVSTKTLGDWADRIRKLAKEGE